MVATTTTICFLVSSLKRLRQCLLLSYLGPLQFTLICIVLIINLYVKFYPKRLGYLYFLIFHSETRCDEAPLKEETLNETESRGEIDINDVRINREEVAFAMERIYQPTTKEGEQIKNCMGYEGFSDLFQDSEPGLDEVEEAFSVFDQNRDGLVDARDLQRVLTNLGLRREGTNLEACQRMIEQHDRNGDGSVDLIDFSRLLEMSLF